MSDETSPKPETPTTEATPPQEPEEVSAVEANEAEEEEEAVDAASPEAIAKRVAALGEEDDIERIARDEEQKLAERRRQGKKKGGLEAAASKRLAKIGAKAPPPKRAIATAADVDPLIARTTQLSKWAKQNQSAVSAVVGVALLGLIGFAGYTWWQQKREGEASATLTQAVEAQRGRIGDPDKEKTDENENRPKDPRPLFKTVEARRDAALDKYREVESKYKGTGAAYLARLEEAGLLLDKGDLDGALGAYSEAQSSPLAQVDAEVKGRALEGMGFVHERKAVADAAGKDAHFDDALKAFRELENTDVQGFKELGMYHQARVLELKGDKDKAKELLKSLHERLTKPGENHPFPYLEHVADDRLRALDPTALPPKAAAPPMGMGGMGGMGGLMGGGGPGGKMNDEQLRRLIEQMQRQQGAGSPLSPAPAGRPIPPPPGK